jgi:hypothetical protein
MYELREAARSTHPGLQARNSEQRDYSLDRRVLPVNPGTADLEE